MFSSGQRIVTPKIVQPGSGNWKWWLIISLLLVAVCSWFVFDFGRQRAGLDVHSYNREIDQLQDRLKLQAKRVEELRVESAAYQRAAQIDKNAVKIAQQDLKLLQQEKAELKREVDILNGLLSDKAVKAVIRLKRLSVTRASAENMFFLRFTLVHLTNVGGRAQGLVSVTVSGSQDGKEKQLTLADMTADKSKTLKMGFKSFQEFEATLTLPDNFTPASITIAAEVEGKTLENFKQTQAWGVAEN